MALFAFNPPSHTKLHKSHGLELNLNDKKRKVMLSDFFFFSQGDKGGEPAKFK